MEKILIVDDNQANRHLIEAMLVEANENYIILTADSGEMALEIIKDDIPSLILMDIMMPGMSGFEVCKRLKDDKRYNTIPIVFVTGNHDEDSKIKCLEVGGDDYITKPINFEQLSERVKVSLRKKRILVIDDEEDILNMLAIILRQSGFDVITANNGKDGLSIFKDMDIPVVLVDVKMPEVSGIDVLKAVKALSPDCVVIIMTGYASVEDSIAAVKLGAYDYLTKPFENPEDVQLVCQRGLEQYYFIQQKKRIIETLKRLNQEILNKTEQLEITQAQLVQSAKLAAMGELGAGIAHELNQPLMGIAMYIQSVLKREGVKNDGDAIDILEKIKKQVNRMSGVVANLRTFARDAEPQYEEIEINKPLEEGYNLLRQQMIDQGIEAELCLGENLPMVIGDSNRLQQVFINIIANAKDALNDMEDKKDKRVYIQSKISCAGRMVEVRVDDNGPGIDDVIKEKLFDPFFTTKPEGKGTGLGLSISYGIIKEHHGCILVEENSGGGAAISIFLPCADNSEKNIVWKDTVLCCECGHYRESKICDVILGKEKEFKH